MDWALTACWPLIGAYGVQYFSGPIFATAGLAIGALIVAPALASQGRWRRLLDPKTGPVLAAMGLLSGTAGVIYISALGYTTPANAAIMAQSEVLYSAVLCSWLLGETITKAQGLASLLIVAGTGLIMLHDLQSPRWKGDLMVLLTPWMYQLSHMLSKKLPKGLDAQTMTGGRIVFGLLATMPICAWAFWTGAARWSAEPRALAILALQGVTMSYLNFVLWYAAIRGMDLSKATAVMLSYPALTVLFSWALGRERISAMQVAGLAVSLTGAYWVSMLIVGQRGEPAETVGTDLIP